MSSRALYITGSILVIVLFLVIRLLVMEYRRDAESEVTRFVMAEAKQRKKNKRKERRLQVIYRVMSHIPFASSYIRMAENAYSGVCPYDTIYLQRLVAQTAFSTIGWAAVFVSVILLTSFFLNKGLSVYGIGCSIFAVYISGKEVLQYRYRQKETQWLLDFDRYLSATSNSYARCKDIPESILEGAEGLNYEMRKHAYQMNSILTASSREEKVKQYALSQRTHKFLKALMVQAYEVSERGDVYDGDSSLFARNLESLRFEVMQEHLSKEKRAFALQGYALVAVVPLFFMEIIQRIASSFSSGMDPFYGGIGKIIVLFTFLVSFISYDLINKAREVNTKWLRPGNSFLRMVTKRQTVKKLLKKVENKEDGFFGKIRRMLLICGENTSLGVFFLKMLFTGAVVFLIMVLFMGYVHQQKKEDILSKVENAEMWAVTSSSAQREAITEVVLIMIREHKDDYGLNEDRLKIEFRQRLPLKNDAIISSAAKEILKQIQEYQEEYIHWYEFLGCMLLGIASAFIPVISLKYRYGLVEDGRDNEVRQFQTIIMMERMFPNTTVQSLLEEMESFAVVFKPSLRDCINNCAFSTELALQKLKDEEADHTWFVQIVDCLLASDSVGIKEAFDNIENNQVMCERVKAFKEEVSFARKKDRTDIVALLPAVMVLGFYFIIPFMWDCLTGVFEMFDMLEQLQKGLK